VSIFIYFRVETELCTCVVIKFVTLHVAQRFVMFEKGTNLRGGKYDLPYHHRLSLITAGVNL